MFVCPIYTSKISGLLLMINLVRSINLDSIHSIFCAIHILQCSSGEDSGCGLVEPLGHDDRIGMSPHVYSFLLRK